MIYIEKHFNLDQLNSRIVYFAYGPTDIKNRPIEISDIKGLYDRNEKSIRQRGLAFWCLLRLLPLMVGDFIPQNNVYWEFFLELRQVCDILFAQKWSVGMFEQFRELYAEHQRNFVRLFPQLTLIPKHHFLSHYGLFAETTGPPYKNMLAAEEMKGNFFKRTSGIMCNFRNVTFSLAKKHQIFAYANILSGKILKERLEIHHTTTISLDTVPCSNEIMSSLGINPLSGGDIQLLTKFVVQGQNYKAGNIIVVHKTEIGTPVFGSLIGAVSRDHTPKTTEFLVKLLNTIGFDHHFYSYDVEKCDTHILIPFNSLLDYHPLDIYSKRLSDQGYYVCPRYHVF